MKRTLNVELVFSSTMTLKHDDLLKKKPWCIIKSKCILCLYADVFRHFNYVMLSYLTGPWRVHSGWVWVLSYEVKTAASVPTGMLCSGRCRSELMLKPAMTPTQ